MGLVSTKDKFIEKPHCCQPLLGEEAIKTCHHVVAVTYQVTHDAFNDCIFKIKVQKEMREIFFLLINPGFELEYQFLLFQLPAFIFPHNLFKSVPASPFIL